VFASCLLTGVTDRRIPSAPLFALDVRRPLPLADRAPFATVQASCRAKLLACGDDCRAHVHTHLNGVQSLADESLGSRYVSSDASSPVPRVAHTNPQSAQR